MSVTLATAWHPRGELGRFQKLLPLLQEVYSGIAISLPPDVDPALVDAFREWERIWVYVTPEWPQGRLAALRLALETPATHIQYTDFDRLLRWVETHEQEWRRILVSIEKCECLVVGRTPAAYRTHPQALVRSEIISNQVTSFLLGQAMDVSAGCKGFSRSAAELIARLAVLDQPFGADAEWPVLVQRAGYKLEYQEVEGLDWESADRFQEQAAGPERQVQAAEAYDADPQHWAYRVEVAREIVQAGLEAARRPLSRSQENK